MEMTISRTSTVIAVMAVSIVAFVAVYLKRKPVTRTEMENPTVLAIPEVAQQETLLAVNSEQEVIAKEDHSVGQSPQKRRPQIANQIGVEQKLVSLDFEKYLVFAVTASAAEQFNQQMLSAVKAQYGLTDDEMEKILAQSAMVVRADREHQKKLQQDICSKRSQFQSLYSFGMALNEFDKSVEANQLSLAREAESSLGTEISSKIQIQLAQQPQRQVSVVDGSTFLPASNRDLSEVIDGFCGVPILPQG